MITDQVLIGSDSDSVTHTQRAEDVQDLSTRSHKPSSFPTQKHTDDHDELDDHVTPGPDLVVASVFVEQRDDGLYVSSLDDVQSFWTLNQDAVKNLQDP